MEYSLQDIKQTIQELFSKQFSMAQVEVDKNYFDGNRANSIDALELLMEIENIFKFSIDDNDLNADLISSINNVSTYVYDKLNGLKNGE